MLSSPEIVYSVYIHAHTCTQTHTHTRTHTLTHAHTRFPNYRIDWIHARFREIHFVSKRRKVLQEVWKKLILSGEVRGCIFKEVTYTLTLKRKQDFNRLLGYRIHSQRRGSCEEDLAERMK